MRRKLAAHERCVCVCEMYACERGKKGEGVMMTCRTCTMRECEG